MTRRRSLVWPLLAVLVAALAAGCGGGGDEDSASADVPANAVAVVAGTPVLRADFERLFEQVRDAYKAQGQEFPAAGTPEYEALKNQVVNRLVSQVKLAKEAQALGITVTDETVTTRLAKLKEQYFGDDQAKYQEELKKQGLTEEDVRANLRARLISEAIYQKLTKDVTVTDDEVRAYYDENQDRFTTAESREVAHILVKTKKKADELYAELQDGADFAELAKENSIDESSKENGGKVEDVRGTFVPEFEEVAFSLETGDIAEPVKSQFGWHIIKALADTKPEAVTPFDEVESSIRDTVLKEKKNKVVREWAAGIEAKYASQIAYAVGFAPAPAADLPADTSTSTTGTGQ